MDFDLSDDQRLLVDTVASFARKDSPLSRFRTLRDEEPSNADARTPLGFSRETLKKMGDLGWLGLPFPESVGGLGGKCIDVALVLEQLGATLVPEPVVSGVILPGLAVLHAGSAAQHEALLPPLIAGEKLLGLAYAETESRHDLGRVTTRATRTASGYELSGEKRFILDGHAADGFVVSARTSGAEADRDGVSLFVVDKSAPGLTVRPVRMFDGRRAAMLSFAGVKLAEEARLGAEGKALPALEKVIDYGAACACAEGVGLMNAVLGITRDYISQREQFGVKIGSFQALQHKAVDMFVETELAKSTMILGALAAEDEDDETRARGVSAAKVQLSIGGRLVVQQAIQLHGGIGITDEADVGLYFKRMHVLQALFGDEDHHLARFASLPGFAA